MKILLTIVWVMWLAIYFFDNEKKYALIISNVYTVALMIIVYLDSKKEMPTNP